jgi:hypothetical protein
MDVIENALVLAQRALDSLMARCETHGDLMGRVIGRQAVAAVDDALKQRRAEKPTAEQLLLGPVDDSANATGPSMRFVIPTPPSSKNTQKMRVIPGGKKGLGIPIRYRPSEVIEATEGIQRAAIGALRAQAPQFFAERRPLFEDDDVAVSMVHNVWNETVDVVVSQIGSRGKGRTGRRRDVVNLPELVLDAIQKIAYRNDNQVCDLRVWRNVGTPTTSPGV